MPRKTGIGFFQGVFKRLTLCCVWKDYPDLTGSVFKNHGF